MGFNSGFKGLNWWCITWPVGFKRLNSKVTGCWLGDCSSISIVEILFTLATMLRPSLWWKQPAIQWTQRAAYGQESSRWVNVNTHLNTGVRNVWNSRLNLLVHLRGMLFSHNDCFIVVNENGHHHYHHHHHISVMELGHLLTRSGLMHPEVASKVCHDSFCQLGNSVSLS